MTARIILNPYSGRYTGRRRWPDAQAALAAAGFAYELAETERPGHARELARDAALAGCSPIIAAGGDGTVSEVVNGLADAAGKDAGPLGPIGILPVGTANDIVDTLGIPRDLAAAAQVLAHGNTRLMDLGEVNGRLFVNNSAIGLEPFVTLIQQRIGRIQGPPRYLLAALRGILARPRWNMRLEWDGGTYGGPITLVAIGNGPRSGGLFYMAPHADLCLRLSIQPAATAAPAAAHATARRGQLRRNEGCQRGTRHLVARADRPARAGPRRWRGLRAGDPGAGISDFACSAAGAGASINCRL